MTTLLRKQVLVAGFGKYSTGLGISGEAVTKMVEADMKEASEHGFDCVLLHLNPNDNSGARQAAVEALKEKPWDGFAVGYGVRGIREMTPLFEDVMNAARTYAPQARLMFTTAPDGLVDALKRVFPDSFR